jgi:hypothetical protein
MKTCRPPEGIGYGMKSDRCPAGHRVPVVVAIARDPSLRARLFFRACRSSRRERSPTDRARRTTTNPGFVPAPKAYAASKHQAIPAHVNGYAFSESTARKDHSVREISTFFEVLGLTYHSSITMWEMGARKCMILKTERCPSG